MKKTKLLFFTCFIAFCLTANTKTLPEQKAPYQRPIGFTLNAAGIGSLTYEGRFNLGLFPYFSLVVSPSFQYTMPIPVVGWITGGGISYINNKRFNLGLGIRHNVTGYDSRNGFFYEIMLRNGGTIIGDDSKTYYSLIPSFMLGYSVVRPSGFTMSYGGGVLYEGLFGEKEYHADKLYRNYFTYVLPLTAEISFGWTW